MRNFSFLPSKSYKLSAKSYSSFTLIEILVASSIFTAILALSIGSFTQSIGFSSSSTNERISRQAGRAFTDWLTRQLKQVGSTEFAVAGSNVLNMDEYLLTYDNDAKPNCTGNGAACDLPTIDYTGNGYILLSKFGTAPGNSNNRYWIADPGSVKGVSAIILPIVNKSDRTTVVQWMYIGTCSGSNPVIKKTADNNLQNDPCSGSNWIDVGQIFPAEASVTNLKFYGLTPRAISFDASGNINKYNNPIQPYLTWSFSVAPISDPTNINSYETTLTSRDYNFAFPQCSQTTCQ